jgi:MFS family permease
MPDIRGAADQPVPRTNAILVAACGSLALASAMGVGRFAITPLMPLMLHEGTITLDFASALASANYLGYLAGALLSMGIPRAWSSAALVKLGLIATALATFGMALPAPMVWLLLRFVSGMASAVVLVFTSEWCLARLAQLGRAPMGAAMFTGPGIGIAVSGFAATGMAALHWSAASNWLIFGLLAVVLALIVWPAFSRPGLPAVVPSAHPQATLPEMRSPKKGSGLEMLICALAYGLAGFGYIVTATFLPVIARQALPGSVWLDLFWPIFGLATIAGALLAMRVPKRFDPRLILVACYLVQATGVAFTRFVPSVWGFVLGSLLTGLPFTAIGFFALQEARRLRPHHAAKFIGLLTTLYSLGQIAGPPFVAVLLAHTKNKGQGFALALEFAAGSLVIGGALNGLMRACWPASMAESSNSLADPV